MNKKLTIIIPALIALVVIGGYLVLSNKSTKTQNPDVTQNQTAQSTSTSIKDLLSSGSSQKCTFSDSETGSQGTVYIANSKMRGDFEMTANGQVTKSHMIVDGQTANLWMDGQTQGFKMSWERIESQQSAQGSVDVNKKADYKCAPWTVDSSLFAVPTNVTFQDLGSLALPSSATKTSSASGSTNNNSSQCSVCNSLTGDSKTQCLKALNCNQ
jgi:hypothetical protein